MTTTTGQSSAAPMNLFARFLGIITSPKATFGSVVAHPKWFGMYLLTAALIGFSAGLPMSTEAGKQAALDQQVSTMESMGFQVGDQQYEAMRQGMQNAHITTPVTVIVFSIVMLLIMAAILWAIFNAAMGGDAKYKTILTVTVHSGVITALGAVFSGVINYFRGSVASATSLGALLPMLDDQTFIGKLFGMIDIFHIWWLIVLAMGLAVLYRRKTQPIAITLFGIYAAFIVAFAAFMSR